MGDRYTWWQKCPNEECKGEVKYYDAPSSLMYVGTCDTCNWREPRDYYEINSHEIVLCTPEEARKNGGLVICKNCNKEVMGSYIEKGGCIECRPHSKQH